MFDIKQENADQTRILDNTADLHADQNKKEGIGTLKDYTFGEAGPARRSFASGDAGGQVWERIAKYALYALIFLTPLFFLPWGISPVVQNKQFLATVLISIALIAWLAKTIASGKLVWAKTPLNIAAWVLIAVWAASSFFSMSKYRSIGLVGTEPDNLLNMLKYVLAFFLIAATFRQSSRLAFSNRGEKSGLQEAIYALLASIAVLAVFTGLKLCGINFLPYLFGGQAWDFAKTADFNTIGTINGLALFLGFGLVLVVGLLAGRETDVEAENGSQDLSWKSRTPHHPPAGGGTGQANSGVQIGLIALAVVIAVELLLINFRPVWWAMIGAMIFLVAYIFSREAQEIRQGKKSALGTQKLILPLVILGVSVILLLVKLPVADLFSFSQEVSPNHALTYSIAKSALKSEGIASNLLGSGPSTFSFDYGLYRGPLNNQHPVERLFWGVRFSQGSSFALTSLAIVGILGALAVVFFILAFLWQMVITIRGYGADLKMHRGSGADHLNIVFACAVLFILISWFLYPANFSLLMFVFIGLGLMVAANVAGEKSLPTSLLQREEQNNAPLYQRGERGDLREISLLTSPQRTLVVSLVLIVLMIGAVSFLYLESQKYAASLYFASGLKVFNETRDPDLAFEKIRQAINLDGAVDDYNRVASQIFLVKANDSLNKLQSATGAAGETLRAEFQSNIANTVSFAQQAQAMEPNESLNWTNSGYVYENILLFVDEAEEWINKSYEKATELEPQNPALRADLGRGHLAVADKIQIQINQIASSEKTDQSSIDFLNQKRNEEIQKGIAVLEEAVRIKADYSPAHFLLAQAYTRQGDVKKAIQKSADYYSLNSADPGAAFQLGFLLYKDNQHDSARLALERAVELSNDYSNARYFLGLIYDAQGNKDKAKEQFEKIAALNPDNQEVKKILANLNNNKPALDGIVPPAAPPAERKETPIPETGGAPAQSIAP